MRDGGTKLRDAKLRDVHKFISFFLMSVIPKKVGPPNKRSQRTWSIAHGENIVRREASGVRGELQIIKRQSHGA